LLAKLIKAPSTQLIHVHCPFAYDAFRWALRLSGARRIVHVHIETSANTLQRAFRDPPELIVTCARFLADQVRSSLEGRSDRVRIEALPNSVDVTKFHAGDRAIARRKVGICTDKAVVLILANIARHKGHATAIRAIMELRKQYRNVELWCAGVERDGDAYTTELRELVSQLNLTENVRFLGYRNDAPELLRAADALLLPSTHEGLPLTILEAQATKIPVVVAPTAGIPEVVSDGQTGFLVPNDDFQGYADRLEKLLSTARIRSEITACAYANILANHTWDVYRRRMFQLYDEVSLNNDLGN
jgi:glycosyltransferase involved in cell wall biosynthesis